MRTLAFFSGVITATVVGLAAIEVWVHLMEHTAYTKMAR